MKTGLMIVTGCSAAVMVLSGSCFHSPVAAQTPSDFTDDFKGIWEVYQVENPLFDHKGINWMDVGNDYYQLVQECTTREEFYQILEEMLVMLEDGSICFETFEGEPDDEPSPEDYVFPWQNDFTPNVDYGILMSNYLDQYSFQTCTLGFGYCDPQLLPYAMIDTLFVDDHEVGLPCLDAFVSQCCELEVPAVIIDLRVQNSRSMIADSIAGRFTDTMYPSVTLRSRGGPEYWQYFDCPQAVRRAGAQQFTGTVIVLMGEQNCGGTEVLCAEFGYNPDVVLVGDTTMGSVSETSNYPLITTSYIQITVPRTTVIMKDGTWLEGTAVPPDIYVPATPGDFASGTDPVLEYAIELLEQYR